MLSYKKKEKKKRHLLNLEKIEEFWVLKEKKSLHTNIHVLEAKILGFLIIRIFRGGFSVFLSVYLYIFYFVDFGGKFLYRDTFFHIFVETWELWN